MKKILIYFNSMNAAGGIERVIATLANKLSAEFDITILVRDEPTSFYKLNDKVKIDTVNIPVVLNMDSQVSRIFTIIKSIYTISKKLGNYLTIQHFDYYYLAYPLNVLEFYLAKGDFNRLIISEHGARINYNTVYRLIKKLLYRKSRKYVIPTITDTQSYIKENLPAINLPHFKSELSYQLAKKQRKVVLNIGRFTADKQQLLLLKIWKNVISEKKYDDWTLHIVGSGELQNEINNFIAENDLNKYVKLLHPQINVEAFYLEAAIFALTSASEGYGMVLLEAISFGLPCVSFDCPSGPRDIIKEEFNGYLIDPKDEGMFIARLKGLMNDKELIDTMGANAYHSSANWSDEVIFEKWRNILN